MTEYGNLVFQGMRLALRDWAHEFGLSICGVLALASILAPLLILHGVHMGVVERLRENLLRDPAVLVIVPQGSGLGFDEEFIAKMNEAPGMRYAIGRTRSVAAELQLTSPGGQRLTLPLDATSPGDPLLENFEMPVPVSESGKLQIVLSASAAKKLNAEVGQIMESGLARRQASGKLERLPLQFNVVAILPPLATSNDLALVDMQTLQALQDFRDGIAAPLINFSSERSAPAQRRFESFRAYATDLDTVEGLEKWFLSHEVPVHTRGRDIAAIRKIDSTLGAVIGLIAGAGVAGFFAFMASTSEASVRRKWKQMGMLRLTGFNNISILIFPLTQALATGIAGCLLAFVVYGAVAFSIDIMFAAEAGGQEICSLSFLFLLGVFFCVQILAILASLRSALKASSISPAVVIRET